MIIVKILGRSRSDVEINNDTVDEGCGPSLIADGRITVPSLVEIHHNINKKKIMQVHHKPGRHLTLLRIREQLDETS